MAGGVVEWRVAWSDGGWRGRMAGGVVGWRVVTVCARAAVCAAAQTVLWDRWSVHRGSLVRHYLASRANIHVEWLPPQAPDLNPVEWLWKLLKYDRLANHGCLSIDQLQAVFEAEYRDVISKQHLLRSCIEGSELPLQVSR